jgi:Ca2+-dependent lipid-binding protein
VKNKTLSPVYNETFSYHVSEALSIEKIAISCFVKDHNVAKRNEVIGVVNIGRKVTSKLGREHWDRVLQSPRKEVSFWHPIQLEISAQKKRWRGRPHSIGYFGSTAT